MIEQEGYTLDAALLERPGNVDIQLDLFLDYANNVKLYLRFQSTFEPRNLLLAVWGKFDPYPIPREQKRSRKASRPLLIGLGISEPGGMLVFGRI
jgi:hypothetical protein